MKNALKIDVTTKQVTKIQINDYKEIYQHIGNGCELFCCPVEFKNGDTIFADDEGLLQEKIQGCFMLPNWKTPIVGNAVILGSNDEGESIDCKTTPEQLQSQIIWGNETLADDYRNNLPKPQIIF